MVVLAAVVHVIRHNTIDLVIFVGVAALMVVEPHLHVTGRRRPAWLERRAAAATTAATLGVVVGVTERNSPIVEAALAVVGVIALALVLRAGPGAPPAGPAPRWWVWAFVLVAGCLLELADFLSQPDPETDNLDHPTLSGVIEPLLATGWVRAGAAAVWLLVGWGLVRLATQRDPGRRAP